MRSTLRLAEDQSQTSGSNDLLQGPAGNHYDKYGSKNPIARYLMNGFLGSLRELLPSDLDKNSSILEVGCGEGHLLNFIESCYPNPPQLHGVDIDPSVIAEANVNYPRLKFSVCNIYDVAKLPLNAPLDLVVCCETLEHIREPERALEAMLQLPCDSFIFSVPREPLWNVLNLARLKYVRDLGNTPGHIQHWGKNSFSALIRKYFDLQAVRSPVPWTMVRAQRRS